MLLPPVSVTFKCITRRIHERTQSGASHLIAHNGHLAGSRTNRMMNPHRRLQDARNAMTTRRRIPCRARRGSARHQARRHGNARIRLPVCLLPAAPSARNIDTPFSARRWPRSTRSATSSFLIFRSRSMRPIRHLTPRYVVDRLAEIRYQRKFPDAPWLTPAANAFLASFLTVADVGFELGSGRSTLWLARRMAHVTSRASWHYECGAASSSGNGRRRGEPRNVLHIHRAARRCVSRLRPRGRTPSC
jgi:hypothetical protein